ncbi:hypothetical protein [Gilvibacter sp.]|uniref:hypothetical protein n=1 Tax=Gilvibacter sp. TaxID=2729997 RepID=UPI0025B7A81D|nr:hypothetical protein [Gilvibacter sp.]NQX76705.1 hypothetical protein [Gilvibacter sp.]
MRFLNPIPPVKVVFSIAVVLLGAYLLTQGTMFGLILMGVAARLSMREGAEVNVFEKKYRHLYSVWGVTIGSWKPLPEIEYVSVFKTVKNYRARVWVAEAAMGKTVYRINLFYQRNKHITVYEGDTKEDAMDKADGIAASLNIEVYDATRDDD